MRNVTVNRTQHRSTFEAALEGYRRRLQRELERRITDLHKGRRVDVSIRLPEPEDHTADYDRILMMATMNIEDTITLSADEFAMYVMDQWHWKQDFTDTATRYE